MPNLENFLAYEHWQYDTVRHLLALTAAVFLAGFVYFLATSGESAPHYRLSSTISAVVMVSAALEVLHLWLDWTTAFSHDAAAGLWRPTRESLFSNGARYVNWSIDVPMLLTQVLVVLGFQGAAFWRRWWRLAASGLLMVWTGYVGQYYEPPAAGLAPEASEAPFWIWFLVSSAFYLHVLYELRRAINRPEGDMPESAAREFERMWLLVLVSWTLYPLAYLVPAFWADADGVLARQGLLTVADITSKLVFGVMLGRAARFRSAHEGWGRALAADNRPTTAPAIREGYDLGSDQGFAAAAAAGATAAAVSAETPPLLHAGTAPVGPAPVGADPLGGGAARATTDPA